MILLSLNRIISCEEYMCSLQKRKCVREENVLWRKYVYMSECHTLEVTQCLLDQS